MTIPLWQLIKEVENIDPSAKDKVRDACARANRLLRDRMKSETRLGLSVKDPETGNNRVIQVPYHVVPGCPAYAEKVELPDTALFALEIARIRTLLTEMDSHWDKFRKLNRRLSAEFAGFGIDPVNDSNFGEFPRLVGDLLGFLEENDPTKEIFNVRDDVLGQYIYRNANPDNPKPQINIYWGIITLVSNLIGVKIEDLAIKVLAHEIAHAYTHVGGEIDGTRWNSSRFSDSSRCVKEGLAQYFTHVVLKSIEDMFPSAFTTYEKLRELQPEAYRCHVPWTEQNTSEEIRRAMLEGRRRDQLELDDLNSLISSSKSALRRDQSSNAAY